jgi:hypothetical protein
MDSTSEIGPIDYLLVEWPGKQPNGEVAPHLVDLVDRGLIRILDLVFVAKDEEGNVAALELADLGGEVAELAVFEGAASGLLGDEDVEEAGGVLEPAAASGRSSRTAGRRRSSPPSATRAASWLPVAGSRSKTSSRRWTPPRPTSREEHPMPGLLRGMARTAAIAGTATAVSNRVSRRQGERWAEQEQQAAVEAQAAPAPAAPAPGPGSQASVIDQLKELGELKAQGILTEEEFAAQKAKLLSS